MPPRLPSSKPSSFSQGGQQQQQQQQQNQQNNNISSPFAFNHNNNNNNNSNLNPTTTTTSGGNNSGPNSRYPTGNFGSQRDVFQTNNSGSHTTHTTSSTNNPFSTANNSSVNVLSDTRPALPSMAQSMPSSPVHGPMRNTSNVSLLHHPQNLHHQHQNNVGSGNANSSTNVVISPLENPRGFPFMSLGSPQQQTIPILSSFQQLHHQQSNNNSNGNLGAMRNTALLGNSHSQSNSQSTINASFATAVYHNNNLSNNSSLAQNQNDNKSGSQTSTPQRSPQGTVHFQNNKSWKQQQQQFHQQQQQQQNNNNNNNSNGGGSLSKFSKNNKGRKQSTGSSGGEGSGSDLENLMFGKKNSNGQMRNNGGRRNSKPHTGSSPMSSPETKNLSPNNTFEFNNNNKQETTKKKSTSFAASFSKWANALLLIFLVTFIIAGAILLSTFRFTNQAVAAVSCLSTFNCSDLPNENDQNAIEALRVPDDVIRDFDAMLWGQCLSVVSSGRASGGTATIPAHLDFTLLETEYFTIDSIQVRVSRQVSSLVYTLIKNSSSSPTSSGALYERRFPSRNVVMTDAFSQNIVYQLTIQCSVQLRDVDETLRIALALLSGSNFGDSSNDLPLLYTLRSSRLHRANDDYSKSFARTITNPLEASCMSESNCDNIADANASRPMWIIVFATLMIALVVAISSFFIAAVETSKNKTFFQATKILVEQITASATIMSSNWGTYQYDSVKPSKKNKHKHKHQHQHNNQQQQLREQFTLDDSAFGSKKGSQTSLKNGERVGSNDADDEKEDIDLTEEELFGALIESSQGREILVRKIRAKQNLETLLSFVPRAVRDPAVRAVVERDFEKQLRGDDEMLDDDDDQSREHDNDPILMTSHAASKHNNNNGSGSAGSTIDFGSAKNSPHRIANNPNNANWMDYNQMNNNNSSTQPDFQNNGMPFVTSNSFNNNNNTNTNDSLAANQSFSSQQNQSFLSNSTKLMFSDRDVFLNVEQPSAAVQHQGTFGNPLAGSPHLMMMRGSESPPKQDKHNSPLKDNNNAASSLGQSASHQNSNFLLTAGPSFNSERRSSSVAGYVRAASRLKRSATPFLSGPGMMTMSDNSNASPNASMQNVLSGGSSPNSTNHLLLNTSAPGSPGSPHMNSLNNIQLQQQQKQMREFTRVGLAPGSMMRRRRCSGLFCKLHFDSTIPADHLPAISELLDQFVFDVSNTAKQFQGVVVEWGFGTALVQWNGFTPYGLHETQACLCALALAGHFQHYEENSNFKSGDQQDVANFSICVNSGIMTFGMCGTVGNLSPFCIGDCVNQMKQGADLGRIINCRVISFAETMKTCNSRILSAPVDIVTFDNGETKIVVHELRGDAFFDASAKQAENQSLSSFSLSHNNKFGGGLNEEEQKARPHYMRGFMYLSQGRFEEAFQNFLQARDINPSDGQITRQLWVCYKYEELKNKRKQQMINQQQEQQRLAIEQARAENGDELDENLEETIIRNLLELPEITTTYVRFAPAWILPEIDANKLFDDFIEYQNYQQQLEYYENQHPLQNQNQNQQQHLYNMSGSNPDVIVGTQPYRDETESTGPPPPTGVNRGKSPQGSNVNDMLNNGAMIQLIINNDGDEDEEDFVQRRNATRNNSNATNIPGSGEVGGIVGGGRLSRGSFSSAAPNNNTGSGDLDQLGHNRRGSGMNLEDSQHQPVRASTMTPSNFNKNKPQTATPTTQDDDEEEDGDEGCQVFMVDTDGAATPLDQHHHHVASLSPHQAPLISLEPEEDLPNNRYHAQQQQQGKVNNGIKRNLSPNTLETTNNRLLLQSPGTHSGSNSSTSQIQQNQQQQQMQYSMSAITLPPTPEVTSQFVASSSASMAIDQPQNSFGRDSINSNEKQRQQQQKQEPITFVGCDCDLGRFPDREGRSWTAGNIIEGRGEFGFTRHTGVSVTDGSLAELTVFHIPDDYFVQKNQQQNINNTNVDQQQQYRQQQIRKLQDAVEESRQTQSIRHACIQSCISVALSLDYKHFILIKETCGGGSLFDLICKFGPLGITALRRFSQDIAKGLFFYHNTRNCPHGAIDCKNVLLSVDGFCKLVTTGVTTNTSNNNSNNNNNHDNHGKRDSNSDNNILLGAFKTASRSDEFVAPELCEKGDEATFAGDIWGFGILLCYMYSGESPYSHVLRETTTSPGRTSQFYGNDSEPSPARSLRSRIGDYSVRPENPIKNKNGNDINAMGNASISALDFTTGDETEEMLRGLIDHCLHPNISKRCTVQQILSHPFFLF